jgi:hypothetical protein
MSAKEEDVTNDGDDTRLEALLLQRVLDLQPTRVNTDELARDLAGGEDEFADRDAVERAIAELTRSGLLHPIADDGFVTPTRASIRLGELLGPVT